MERKSTRIMREQIKRGYLKLAILYALIKGPLHGYELIKKIKENTFDLLTPRAGSLYPALKELEADGLIKGEWQHRKRRIKVYAITDKGREAFREVIEKHFSIASAISKWILTQFASLHFIENIEATPVFMQAVKIILLDENAAVEEKIEALKDFRERLQRLNEVLGRLVTNVDKRIKSLEAETKSFKSNIAAEHKTTEQL